MSVCITRFHMNSINTKLTSVINFNNVNFPFHFTFNQLQRWIIFLLSVRLSITMHCRKNYVLFMLYSVRSKKSSAQFYVIYFKFKNRLYSLWTIINKKSQHSFGEMWIYTNHIGHNYPFWLIKYLLLKFYAKKMENNMIQLTYFVWRALWWFKSCAI